MSDSWRVLLPVQMDETGPRSIEDIADTTWLGEYETHQALCDDLASYDAIICRGSSLEVSDELLEYADDLKIVSKHGIGVDNIDIAAASDRGIIVTNTPGANTHAVAEHTMGLLLAVRKNIHVANRDVRRGEWDRSKYVAPELRRSTFGLFGCGDIGRKTAQMARAFGADCITYDPYLDEADVPIGIEKVSKTALFERSDVVSVHAPLTDETRNAISTAELDRLSPGILLNTSRGGIVDQDSLVEHLQRDGLAGAGLDVLATEPPEPDDPLLGLDTVVLTPHIAGTTAESAVAKSRRAAENVRTVYEGRIPEDTLNVNRLFEVPNR